MGSRVDWQVNLFLAVDNLTTLSLCFIPICWEVFMQNAENRFATGRVL